MAADAPAIDAVLFDFGGVLVKDGSPRRDLSARFPDVDIDQLLEVFLGPYGEDTDHPWHRVERGELDLAACMELTRAAATERGLVLDAVPVERQPVAFRPNPEMVDLVERVRRAGCRTAVVTNNARELAPLWRPVLALDDLFDAVIDSSEVGLRKPNPAIFRMALERLGGVAPGRAVFLDDFAGHVQAARNLGMHAVLVGDDLGPAIAEVEALVGC